MDGAIVLGGGGFCYFLGAVPLCALICISAEGSLFEDI